MKRGWLFAVPACVLLALAAVYGYLWYSVRQMVQTGLEQLVASGQFEQAAYGHLWLTPSASIQLSDLHLSKPGVDIIIDHIRSREADFFHDHPRYLTVDMDTIRFPSGLQTVVAADTTFLPGLAGLMAQDNTLPVHATLSFRYEPANDEQIMVAGTINMPGYFELQGRGEARQLPMAAVTVLLVTPPALAAASATRLLAQASWRSAEWVLHDTGLVDAQLKAIAASSGTNPEELRTSLMTELGNYYLLLPTNLQAISRPMLGELAGFLQGGRTLTIAINPAFDGSFLGLQQELMGMAVSGNYEKAMNLLQLKITTQ